MKALPVEPGQPRFDDLPDANALQHQSQACLAGHGLPLRWRGQRRFVVLETGFGLGNHFLATWAAWRADAQRCEQLDFVSIERHPLQQADMARALASSPWPELAQALLQQWPPLTPHLHALRFDHNRVSLLLVLGDAARLLPTLQVQADAFVLNGLADPNHPTVCDARVLKALGRKAAVNATVAASTGRLARPPLRQGLTAAGFVLDPESADAADDALTVGRYQPRFAVSRSTDASALRATPPQTALVVGAGLAGAAVARALAQRGLQVTVLEAQPAPALRGSGNPAGLFHGTVNADDGTYARLFRTAALAAQREYALALAPQASPAVAGCVGGLLRLELDPGGLQAMQSLLARQGLPLGYVQALSAQAASSRAGVPLPGPAWFYPGGGWICPPQWVAFALATPGVQTHTHCAVGGLRRQGARWQALGTDGQVLAQADVVVLTHTQSALALLQSMGHAPWPVNHTRGQISHWPAEGTAPQLPVAGNGYVLRVPSAAFGPGGSGRDGGLQGNSWLICGATQHEGQPPADESARLSAADHAHNLARAQQLTGWSTDLSDTRLQGRAGWRLNTADRLPIAGAVACAEWPAGQRQDQARLLPREPGLFVLTGLGARGLTWAPLLAQLVAAQAVGAPWPLEQDLADAVDPARWRVRAARQRGGGKPAANP